MFPRKFPKFKHTAVGQFHKGLYTSIVCPNSNAEPNPDCQIMLKVLALIYLILFLRNFLAMYMVIQRKIRERIADIQWLQHRYESALTLINCERSSFQKLTFLLVFLF
ncbi:unnamed protein product [Rotaria sp. Silwood2]|nr:unnamed protein product [Rotaria sp. Silwood2]CAF3163916.1 unnamed protein product [Rotaria sp. Silwood2]CAF4063626.1 unnamed protein product [Rotaria sp. Silwood2]